MKKPIVKAFGNTMKKSVSMLRRNKNAVKNVVSGVQNKQMTTKHYFGSKTVKYLGQGGMKTFKCNVDSTLIKTTVCKKNIYMRTAGQMKGKEIGSLINMVSRSKSQLPFLFVAGGLGRLIQYNLVPGDSKPWGEGEFFIEKKYKEKEDYLKEDKQPILYGSTFRQEDKPSQREKEPLRPKEKPFKKEPPMGEMFFERKLRLEKEAAAEKALKKEEKPEEKVEKPVKKKEKPVKKELGWGEEQYFDKKIRLEKEAAAKKALEREEKSKEQGWGQEQYFEKKLRLEKEAADKKALEKEEKPFKKEEKSEKKGLAWGEEQFLEKKLRLEKEAAAKKALEKEGINLDREENSKKKEEKPLRPEEKPFKKEPPLGEMFFEKKIRLEKEAAAKKAKEEAKKEEEKPYQTIEPPESEVKKPKKNLPPFNMKKITEKTDKSKAPFIRIQH